jgi:hypothetical protein
MKITPSPDSDSVMPASCSTPQAKAAYRKRLDDLRGEELDEAQGWSDPEGAAKLSKETDFLTHELARAVGLRGRDRRAPSPARTRERES